MCTYVRMNVGSGRFQLRNLTFHDNLDVVNNKGGKMCEKIFFLYLQRVEQDPPNHQSVVCVLHQPIQVVQFSPETISEVL